MTSYKPHTEQFKYRLILEYPPKKGKGRMNQCVQTSKNENEPTHPNFKECKCKSEDVNITMIE